MRLAGRGRVGVRLQTAEPRASPTIACLRRAGRPAGRLPASVQQSEGAIVLLIVGIVLLVIAIAGGAIIHPLLFALGIVALVLFFVGR